VGSTAKRRTTRAKLDREAKRREKRVEKQARKAARRLSAAAKEAVAASGSEELDPGTGVSDGGEPRGDEAESDAASSERERPGI
jgi:hypothetical protein